MTFEELFPDDQIGLNREEFILSVSEEVLPLFNQFVKNKVDLNGISILISENTTLGHLADLLYAFGYKINLEFYPRPVKTPNLN